jgi:hypothetical protein
MEGMRGAVLFAALGVLVGGCFSAGRFPELSQQEQARFHRCFRPMQPVLCGYDRDLVYVTNCTRYNEAKYSEQRTPNLRKQWLVENGCPPSMVSPAAYVAQEDEPVSARVTRRKITSEEARGDGEEMTPAPTKVQFQPAPAAAENQAADEEEK